MTTKKDSRIIHDAATPQVRALCSGGVELVVRPRGPSETPGLHVRFQLDWWQVRDMITSLRAAATEHAGLLASRKAFVEKAVQ